MSWYRTGRVAVTNGSKTVTGVGTLFTTAVNVGDAFALVDANLNPTGAWYEVEAVVSNTEITLKQSYAGTTGSNKQYCVFNLVGNMTTPSFAQRLATFFASFQSLIDKPTATPTALGIPVADENGDIDSGWLKDASASVKGVVELATSAEVLAGTDTTRAVTPDTLTDKILGTVSQVGGVPTGAIIERGSNSNGEYVKFADGTVICTQTISRTDMDIAATYSVYNIESWTLPVSTTFSNKMFIHATVHNTALNKPLYTAVVYVNNGTQLWNTGGSPDDMHPGSAVRGTTSYTANTMTLRLLAIGRWF